MPSMAPTSPDSDCSHKLVCGHNAPKVRDLKDFPILVHPRPSSVPYYGFRAGLFCFPGRICKLPAPVNSLLGISRSANIYRSCSYRVLGWPLGLDSLGQEPRADCFHSLQNHAMSPLISSVSEVRLYRWTCFPGSHRYVGTQTSFILACCSSLLIPSVHRFWRLRVRWMVRPAFELVATNWNARGWETELCGAGRNA